MKMTVLEIVKDILSDMSSDAVNSINDTVEALQVAQIVQTTYFNITDGKDNPWMRELFQLTSSGTTLKPSHMIIPETIINIDSIKYNKRLVTDTRNKFLPVYYKTQEDFLSLLDIRDSSSTTVQVVTDYTGVTLNIKNNKAPQYFTSFDDEHIVFDSFDSAVDATLQTSKTLCFGQRSPTFSLTDTYIPDLPVQMFSYLLNESKSTAFATIKQSANTKAEQHSVSQRRRMSQEKWKLANGITYPNYGRK